MTYLDSWTIFPTSVLLENAFLLLLILQQIATQQKAHTLMTSREMIPATNGIMTDDNDDCDAGCADVCGNVCGDVGGNVGGGDVGGGDVGAEISIIKQ